MKHCLLILLFISTSIAAVSQVVTADVAGGYQVADLRWSIAGNLNGQAINVLSEIKWRALSGPVVGGRLTIHPTRRWFAAGEVSKCFITAGKATDMDYGDNNRSLTTYHAQLDSDEGSMSTLRLSGGYYLVHHKNWQLAASAGYTKNTASLLLLNHAQEALRCTYNTTWKGVSGGVSGNYRVVSWLAFDGELIYSQLKYGAVADWNLIDAFQHPVSFKHHARGYEVRMAVSGVVKLNSYLSLFISGVFRHAATGSGTDELFLDSGAVQVTQLNGVFTSARNLSFGARVQF
ncbi:omptin family outer membrane protease [Chitinophaga sp. sic0106]|uniref:omptin family outer membrane protease n=1 Tax=Chitinophaga sp. sic0106 TaxID=2854785 RepID=UPI001C45AC66|nr:omptin family outer membrane protease [Chitinophaga sp. sic0106]MBV7530636.1 omptin family outer membrane protease [Chitinophaga sp. sic0106]